MEEKKELLTEASEDAKEEEIKNNEQTEADTRASKFKNPEELEKAYGELEKEFTRRSQRLAKLENELNAQSAPKETSEEEWKQIVDKFFDGTPAARPFAKDIALEIVANPELKNSADPLNAALTRVLISKFRTPEQMLSDGQFLNDYVLTSPTVQKAVIEGYVKGLSKGKPPVVMTDGGEPQLTPKSKPRTLEEAGAMFAKNNK